jgi:glycine hydroxymethyltransferase
MIAAKAVMLTEAATPAFKRYAAAVVDNAAALAETLTARGYHLTSGGTDNHLMLVDLTDKGITGRDAANALEAAGICVNKNVIPYDERSPFVTSGIRIGTPALTTRGFERSELVVIGGLIADVLDHLDSAETRAAVQAAVRDLCERHPLYPGYLEG